MKSAVVPLSHKISTYFLREHNRIFLNIIFWPEHEVRTSYCRATKAQSAEPSLLAFTNYDADEDIDSTPLDTKPMVFKGDFTHMR